MVNFNDNFSKSLLILTSLFIIGCDADNRIQGTLGYKETPIVITPTRPGLIDTNTGEEPEINIDNFDNPDQEILVSKLQFIDAELKSVNKNSVKFEIEIEMEDDEEGIENYEDNEDFSYKKIEIYINQKLKCEISKDNNECETLVVKSKSKSYFIEAYVYNNDESVQYDSVTINHKSKKCKERMHRR
jgi:hypothetical protein